MKNLFEILKNNSYPGRGIFIGKSNGGKTAVISYFIMGRSENSRNRLFVSDGNGIVIKAADEAKITDPSLVFYSPVKVAGTKQILTNGIQTDAVYNALKCNENFENALQKFTYEPDAPNYTPRISAVADTSGKLKYSIVLIKKSDTSFECEQNTYTYENTADGTGHLIHTYIGDGSPLQSFSGNPKEVCIENTDIDTFSQKLWTSLNTDNKISLFVRYIDLINGSTESRIINKNTIN